LDDRIGIETPLFTAAFTTDKNCSIEMKNGDCSVAFQEEIRQLLISFGQSKNDMTMVDFISGVVANVGAHRCVYYLNDEWQWALGRQQCSKKDLIQHFEKGTFVERLQLVTEIDPKELTPVIANGQRPRLFVVERNGSSLAVKELLADSDFQTIAALSTTRISKKEDSVVTLWFDTEPKTFREIRITTKLSDEMKARVYEGIESQKEAERQRMLVLNSVGDPKWRELEEREREQEEEITALLKQYNAPPPDP
jgi:hypothetical protein